MIPLTRERTETAVHKNFKPTKWQDFNLELLKDRRSVLDGSVDKQKFKSERWKEAKPQLLKETNSKCAYCEAPTAVVAYGDVEHYRPKSKYWWLAYCYDNYLPSCQLCNQKYKGANFQVANSAMPCPINVSAVSTNSFLDSKKEELCPNPLDALAVDAFEIAHANEWPLILNPYVDDPAEWLAWEVDDVLMRVKLVSNGTADSDAVVKAAEDDLGLNRLELQELRYKEFLKFRVFKLTLQESTISAGLRNQVENAIAGMLADHAAFAGMLRFFDPFL